MSGRRGSLAIAGVYMPDFLRPIRESEKRQNNFLRQFFCLWLWGFREQALPTNPRMGMSGGSDEGVGFGLYPLVLLRFNFLHKVDLPVEKSLKVWQGRGDLVREMLTH